MSLLNKIKSNGLLKRIRIIIQKAVGINKLQNEIDTLNYFLNSYVDIKTIGPTKDEDLRDLQICSTELLYIFHLMCKKYKLVYWLDCGTLLGAIRHNGFIPWDDDIDVAMPREDYDKVLDCMKDELKNYGIDVRWGGYFDNRGKMARLALAYKTLETGAWIDIFPFDTCTVDTFDDNTIEKIYDANRKYHEYYIKNENKISDEKILNQKKEMFKNFNNGNIKVMFHGGEFVVSDIAIVRKDSILPTKEHVFEGYKFCVPSNVDGYLTMEYGKTYMNFPRTGVESHTDPNGSLAKDRAKNTGTNIKKEIAYLHEVGVKIEKELNK